MLTFVIVILVLLILLGLFGMFIAVKYPRSGAESLAQRIDQKVFKRGYMTVTCCSVGLGLLLAGVLEPKETLIITFGIFLAAEYALARVTKQSK